MAKAVRRKKGNVDTLDFSGVKSGGATIPDGRYAAKIISAELKEGKESGELYRDVTWEITSEKCGGREVRFDTFSLQLQSLWKVKSMLEAMEVEVPDGEHDVDWDELIDNETECIIELVGEKKEDGRTFARPVGYAPLSDGNTVDDEEGEEDKPASRKKLAKDEEEDDTPPRRAGKKPKDEEEEEDEPPKRRGKAKDEDEDEEEDEPPRSASKKVKKGAKVKFKDEKNKLTKGTIESIDGDLATVVTDDEDTYEIDLTELTVTG